MTKKKKGYFKMNLLDELKSLTHRKNKSAVISIRVTPELKKSLKHLAEVKDETVSDLFLNALQYQAEHQLDEIKQKRQK